MRVDLLPRPTASTNSYPLSAKQTPPRTIRQPPFAPLPATREVKVWD